MMINKQDIIQYIPQRFPMVMVDELISCDRMQGTTEFEITAGNIFVEVNEMSESGMLENIAQSVACMMGYYYKSEGASEVPRGFIGGISKISLYTLPKVGDKITTHIAVKNEVFGAKIVNGTCLLNGTELLSCEMKVFIESVENS